MVTTQFREHACIVVENRHLRLVVSQSVGPRILSLQVPGRANLLAELPDFCAERPDGQTYHFYGGHRLWLSPEDPIGSYALDHRPVTITETAEGLWLRKSVEPETHIEKAICLTLAPHQAQVTLTHQLTNRGPQAVTYAPWALTQLRANGVAILPQAHTPTGLLPNRRLALWPYTNMAAPQVGWGQQLILLKVPTSAPFKLGFPNPRGWLAYWLDGVLFVKRAAFKPEAHYPDFGSSSECYCNQDFVELETLGPLSAIAPGATVTHTEVWELYADIPYPQDEPTAQAIVAELGLA